MKIIDKKVNTPSLRVNISWTLIANIIYALTQWGLLMAIAKLGTPVMVGQFTLGLALTAPIILLTNLQLRTVQATDINNDYLFKDFIGLRIITILVFILTITFMTIFFRYEWETTLIIIIIAVSKALEALSDIIYGLFQKNEDMKNIAISKIYKGISSLIVMGLILKITDSLIYSLLGLSITWLLILLVVDLRLAKNFESIIPRFKFKNLKTLIIISLPLGFAHMLGSINTNVPRYLLEFYVNQEALGYFAAIAYLIVAGSTVILAIGHVVTPRLSKYFVNDIKKFKKIIIRLMFLGLSIGLIGMATSLVVGEEILTLIYSSEYGEYTDVLLLIMLAATFIYTSSFLGYGITAAKSFKIQPLMNIIWIITSVIAGVYLIPRFEIEGAAYTLVISSLIQFITRIIVLGFLLLNRSRSIERG